MDRLTLAKQKADAVGRIISAADDMGLQLPELGMSLPREADAALQQTVELWKAVAVLFEALAEHVRSQ